MQKFVLAVFIFVITNGSVFSGKIGFHSNDKHDNIFTSEKFEFPVDMTFKQAIEKAKSQSIVLKQHPDYVADHVVFEAYGGKKLWDLKLDNLDIFISANDRFYLAKGAIVHVYPARRNSKM
ncbi:hypothetical protein DdX_17022 [Ditylenchus destructor]|uniref:Uncharacterized protein n=1 Tax=Ditylenchus destructor TaxID=166010 RepID=A0AAD4MNI9_9BILA|nr:hypothetical protein DdX_17022 [Ditylenchus destructor]